MSIILRLAARHLRLNKKRTIITIIGIATSIAMVTAISGFIVSFQDMFYQDTVAREGSWHVRYWGLEEGSMDKIAQEPVFAAAQRVETQQGETLQLEFAKLNRRIFDQSDAICAKYGIAETNLRFNTNLLISKGLVPGRYYEALYVFAGILLSLVAIASVMVISNAFSISAAERSRQFGLLKSVGATSKQIRSAVLSEGAILAVFAIPVGFLLGIFTEWVALTIANSILGSMNNVNLLADFRVVLSPWTLVISVVCALVTIFLAAWLPARRAARISAIEAIRQTETIKIPRKDVRISPLVGKLFGFEGLLAAKTMRRNRGRFRTTILSLVVSIVLFIGVSSFGSLLFKASSMFYGDSGSNVILRLHGDDAALQDELAVQLDTLPRTTIASCRELNGSTLLEPQMMTPQAQELLGAGEKSVYLYSLPDARFAALCKPLGLNPAALADPDKPGAILINATGTYIRQGRRHNFTPYAIKRDTPLAFTLDGVKHQLTIMGIAQEIPQELSMIFSANGVNLLIPESVRVAIQPENMTEYLYVAAMAADAEAFSAQATTLLTDALGKNNFTIINYEAMAANNRNIWFLIMLFVYGFIGLLSLISVTSVVTTISTGIALRRREFAVLRSMGMTQAGVSKSLRYESLICGLKALLYGIPLGILASLAMYYALDSTMSFPYIWPVSSIVISIVAVMALTFSTMWFAGYRQRKDNLIGALQNEVI